MRPAFHLLAIGLMAGGLSACATVKPGLRPEQIAALRQQGFQQTNEGWSFGAEDKVTFASNTATIEPATDVALQRMGHALRAAAIDHLRVNGYTDKYGADSYNDALSLRRAQAVADVLIQGGIPAKGITVQGLGASHPITTGNSASDLAQNRRVAIVVSSE
jgi:outer membrane protein OmpA-like peptidoglycan-associated protein